MERLRSWGLLPLAVGVALLAASCRVSGRRYEHGVYDRHNDENVCVCDDTYKPVCASNRFTYDNMCKVECVKGYFASMSIQLTVLHDGACEGLELQPPQEMDSPDDDREVQTDVTPTSSSTDSSVTSSSTDSLATSSSTEESTSTASTKKTGESG